MAGSLDSAIGIQISRTLAEQIILAPEDAWIERQIVEYASKDEKTLGISAKNYLENALEIFSAVLTSAQKGDSASDAWMRAQTALHRIRGCFACINFAKSRRITRRQQTSITNFWTYRENLESMLVRAVRSAGMRI